MSTTTTRPNGHPAGCRCLTCELTLTTAERATAHRVTVAPTTIAGHPAVLAECEDCNWYDCRATWNPEDAAAIVARNVEAHRAATAEAVGLMANRSEAVARNLGWNR